MKNLAFLGLLVALAVLYFVMTRFSEPFVPEFLDQGNVKQTSKTRTSSYSQSTNHFQMTHPAPEPVPGVETPFRVNMFNSYME